MRLGKKKEKESGGDGHKSQSVDGITRLICLLKGQTPLKGEEGDLMINFHFRKKSYYFILILYI